MELLSPSRSLERVSAEALAGFARGIEEAPAEMECRRREFTVLDLSPDERERRIAAHAATTWRVHDFEPPQHVTRVISGDGQTVAIRGAECWFEGAGHSNWAYILVNGKPRTPGPDSTVPEDTGWCCWLDLDFVNPRWADDTVNDTRRPGELGLPGWA